MKTNERTHERTNERTDECVDDTRTWIYVCIYVFCRRCCWRLRGGDGVVNGCVVNDDADDDDDVDDVIGAMQEVSRFCWC